MAPCAFLITLRRPSFAPAIDGKINQPTAGPINRVHQAKVANVKIDNADKNAPPEKRWLPFDDHPERARAKWQAARWQQHETEP